MANELAPCEMRIIVVYAEDEWRRWWWPKEEILMCLVVEPENNKWENQFHGTSDLEMFAQNFSLAFLAHPQLWQTVITTSVNEAGSTTSQQLYSAIVQIIQFIGRSMDGGVAIGLCKWMFPEAAVD